MDELRAAAVDGLQRLARGGLEVGGVLFGVQRDSGIRILTWRPISCEHALGPGFQFSPRDHLDLKRLLEEAPGDPDLQGLKPVGWFVSHTRSDVSLTPSDQEIFGAYFPEPYHVTLVLHPTQTGPARAGFFARESNGDLKTDASYQEYLIQPLHRGAARRELPPAAPAQRALRTAQEPEVQVQPTPVRAAPVQPPQFGTWERRTTSRRWLWMLPVCLALIIGGVFVKQKYLSPTQSFSLRIYEAAGTIQIVWDVNAAPIRASHLGVIDIKDGNESKRLALSDDELHQGRKNYVRHSGDVELRMAVYPVGSTVVEEFAYFVDPGRAEARAK